MENRLHTYKIPRSVYAPWYFIYARKKLLFLLKMPLVVSFYLIYDLKKNNFSKQIEISIVI